MGVSRMPPQVRRLRARVRRLGRQVPVKRALPWARRMGINVLDAGPGALLLTRSSTSWEKHLLRDKALSDYLTVQHVVALLRRYRVNVVLDVGANIGQYGQQL